MLPFSNFKISLFVSLAFKKKMTAILPEKNITLVLPFPSHRVERALTEKTLRADVTVPQSSASESAYWFRGDVEQREFVLSLTTKSFHSYTPIINGRIESTSNGCIVFMRYQLFKSTRFFMLIWSALTLFLTLLFSFGIPKMNLALLCILLLVSNYIIAVVSFQKQVKLTQEKINQIIAQF